MISETDKIYTNLLKKIKNEGFECSPARYNMPSTKALFGEKLVFNNKVFPILQGKKVSFKNILVELLWFLKGNMTIKYLLDNNCNIWNTDAYRYYLECGGKLSLEKFLELSLKEKSIINQDNRQKLIDNDYNYYGYVGRIYPYQWRLFNEGVKDYDGKCRKTVDQINRLIDNLKKNPFSRYQIVSAWNIGDMEEHKQALPACHILFQCNVHKDKEDNLVLDLMYIQRSADCPLGVPYNIASYAILQRILCKITGYKLGNLICILGNAHYYENQIDYVNEYIERFDNNKIEENSPQLIINDENWKDWDLNFNIDNIKFEDFKLINYKPLSTIKAPLSVGL